MPKRLTDEEKESRQAQKMYLKGYEESSHRIQQFMKEIRKTAKEFRDEPDFVQGFKAAFYDYRYDWTDI